MHQPFIDGIALILILIVRFLYRFEQQWQAGDFLQCSITHLYLRIRKHQLLQHLLLTIVRVIQVLDSLQPLIHGICVKTGFID